MPSTAIKGLQDYLKPGVQPEDVPGLHAILRVQKTMSAFTGLFRGNDEDVIFRVMLLREMGEQTDRASWPINELKAHFSFLDPAKFDSSLHRLREYNLLSQDEETNNYSVSSLGRMIISSLATILQTEEDDGSEVGFILGQVAANELIGNVSAEQLQHLLSRLNELLEQFDRDILSGSEHRIRAAEKRLNSVWSWLEKGTEMIKSIASSSDIDPIAHKIAQRIGQVQSRILRLTSVFQRILNQFESQKVHIGQSGLSSSDVTQWLREQSIDNLVALSEGVISCCTSPAIVINDITLDIAEYELLEREHPVNSIDETLPSLAEAKVSEPEEAPKDSIVLTTWVDELKSVKTEINLPDYLPADNFEHTAYRLSLLALLNDKSAMKLPGMAAQLAKLPLELELSESSTEINKNGVRRMSDGRLKKR